MRHPRTMSWFLRVFCGIALLFAGGSPDESCGQELSLPPLSGDLLAPGLAPPAQGEAPTLGDAPGVAVRPGPAGAPLGPVLFEEGPLLGPHLRARYNTRSYGQVRGTLDLGAMKLYDRGDSAWFIDGQVVLNDENHFGFNAGFGRRVPTLPLLPFTIDTEKLIGLSVWSDGMNTVNDNFFSQIGISMEYLGDYWDVRGNFHAPLHDTEAGELQPTTGVGFLGAPLAAQVARPTDGALTVTEIELARRIGELEAWGFIGGYGLYGDRTDTGGYKLGLRGFATPDISLQLAIVDDDEFGTNAVFSGTWFIGRTRANTPCRAPLTMRLREPVIRNSFIAVKQGTVRR